MKEFYVVTEAKIIKVDEGVRQYALEHGKVHIPGTITNRPDISTVEFKVEHLKGRRFYRSSPKLDVVIAWDSQLQDLLGVPIEAWDGRQEEYARLTTEVWKCRQKLHIVAEAPWWKRLKWVFTGVKEID